MKTTVEYLDEVKARLDLPSDYAAAKVLQVTPSAISKYRLGRAHFDDTTCLRVAEILGIAPFEVIAAANAERSRDTQTRRLWENAWGKATGAAVTTAFAACIVGLAAAPSPAHSTPLESDNGASLHVMSN